MEGVAGDCQHRLPIALGVVQAIQKVNATRARRSQTHAEPAGVLCVAARRESRRFFMPDLDEAQLILMRSKRLEDPVYPIAGKSKNDIDAPIDKPFQQDICNRFRHEFSWYSSW